MKIFVTGETGFIGSELTPKLVEAKHDVYSLVRPVTGRDEIAKTVAKTVFGDVASASIGVVVQQDVTRFYVLNPNLFDHPLHNKNAGP